MMNRALLPIAAVLMAVGLVKVVDGGVSLNDANQLLGSYKELVVNGKKEGKDCVFNSEDSGADKDKVYNWLGEVAGKTPEEIMALTIIDPVEVNTVFGQHAHKLNLCAVSQDLYCKENGDGPGTCTKCGGTCGKKYVELILAAKDWKEKADKQTGGTAGGGSPAPGPSGPGNAPAKNGAVTADGRYSDLLVTVATLITTVLITQY